MLTVASPTSQVVVWLLVSALTAGGTLARVPACCLQTDPADRPACCLLEATSPPADGQSDSCCPSQSRKPVRLPDCDCELTPLEAFWASPHSWDSQSSIGAPVVAFDSAALAAPPHDSLDEGLSARSPQVPLRVLFCTWLI